MGGAVGCGAAAGGADSALGGALGCGGVGTVGGWASAAETARMQIHFTIRNLIGRIGGKLQPPLALRPPISGR